MHLETLIRNRVFLELALSGREFIATGVCVEIRCLTARVAFM